MGDKDNEYLKDVADQLKGISQKRSCRNGQKSRGDG